jgi:hypothetical protein
MIKVAAAAALLHGRGIAKTVAVTTNAAATATTAAASKDTAPVALRHGSRPLNSQLQEPKAATELTRVMVVTRRRLAWVHLLAYHKLVLVLLLPQVFLAALTLLSSSMLKVLRLRLHLQARLLHHHPETSLLHLRHRVREEAIST